MSEKPLPIEQGAMSEHFFVKPPVNPQAKKTVRVVKLDEYQQKYSKKVYSIQNTDLTERMTRNKDETTAGQHSELLPAITSRMKVDYTTAKDEQNFTRVQSKGRKMREIEKVVTITRQRESAPHFIGNKLLIPPQTAMAGRTVDTKGFTDREGERAGDPSQRNTVLRTEESAPAPKLNTIGSQRIFVPPPDRQRPQHQETAVSVSIPEPKLLLDPKEIEAAYQKPRPKTPVILEPITRPDGTTEAEAHAEGTKKKVIHKSSSNFIVRTIVTPMVGLHRKNY